MAKKKPFTAQLNQRIRFYKAENVRNQSAGVVSVKTLYWDTQAKVVPLKSNRSLQALQTQLVDGFHITLRDRIDKDILPDMTINYRGGWLSIISCIPDYVYQEFMVVIGVWSRRPLRLTDRKYENQNGVDSNFTYGKNYSKGI